MTIGEAEDGGEHVDRVFDAHWVGGSVVRTAHDSVLVEPMEQIRNVIWHPADEEDQNHRRNQPSRLVLLLSNELSNGLVKSRAKKSLIEKHTRSMRDINQRLQ